MLQLFIGNKNYSSWSMRPWVLIKQAGIPFEEILVRFDSFDAGSKFKTQMSKVSPTGKVPALVDGDLNLWDTLAIAEYVAEKYPEKNLWPKDASDQKSVARWSATAGWTRLCQGASGGAVVSRLARDRSDGRSGLGLSSCAIATRQTD